MSMTQPARSGKPGEALPANPKTVVRLLIWFSILRINSFLRDDLKPSFDN